MKGYVRRAACDEGVTMAIVISPSILSADFARLGEEVNAVLAAGADWIHFDVMDNHYVPNLTIGPLVCEALRKAGVKAPIDVHLMVSPVDQLVPDFAKAGASYISFHPEATQHVDRTIQLIRDSGCKPGLQSRDAVELAGLRNGQDRSHPDHVGQSGLRRPKVHPIVAA
jgi:ribulose-phosphate 3-epimerase